MKYIVLILSILFALNYSYAENIDESSEDDLQTQESSELNQESEYEYLYFHSPTCPYCQSLDEYLTENWYYSEFWIKKLNVFDDNNQSELNSIWDANSVPENWRWVPFFIVVDWDDWYYFVGDQPVMNFFDAKTSNQDVWNMLASNNMISVLPDESSLVSEDVDSEWDVQDVDWASTNDEFTENQYIFFIVFVILIVIIILFILINPFEKKTKK